MQTETFRLDPMISTIRQFADKHGQPYAEVSICGQQAFRIGELVLKIVPDSDNPGTRRIEVVTSAFGKIITRPIYPLGNEEDEAGGVGPELADMLSVVLHSYGFIGSNISEVLRQLRRLPK